MKSKLLIFALSVANAAAVSAVYGHGIPIQVTVSGGQLVVSGGTVDTNGFSPMIFVQQGEDSDPFGEVTLPSVGPVILWQIPGFDVSGMNNQSDLSIELLDRPVRNTNPIERRVLWHWNAQNQMVQPAANSAALFLLARGNQTLTIQPNAAQAPPPLTLADPINGQQGFHNHSLLNYALDNDLSPPAGAYGFFARLTSSDYTPSGPFLVVFNRGNNYDQMTSAASAISTAALLAGDYDHNDVVNPADYGIWKTRFGQTVSPLGSADGNGNGVVDAADYTMWRNNLGLSALRNGAFVAPEPGTALQSVVALFVLGAVAMRKRI